jgi:hypothetical protein
MTTFASLTTSLGLSALLFACGGGCGGSGTDSDAAPALDSGITPQVDANVDELVWVSLVTGDWSLAAGGEDTNNNHAITLDRDIYVGAIRPIEPVGTHHTVLNNGGTGIIYASGVGTNEVVFPPGVGLKLTAGPTLNLG